MPIYNGQLPVGGQTILGGSIEAGRLVVTTDYRPFEADAYVNNVEVFEGHYLTGSNGLYL
jgi:hypothetical protein